MTKAQHTPGPWIVKDSPSHNGYGVSLANDDHTVSISVFAAYGPREKERREVAFANARVIAAAPDLANGCNALLGLLQLVCGRDDMPEAIRQVLLTNHRVEEARAALAKAGA